MVNDDILRDSPHKPSAQPSKSVEEEVSELFLRWRALANLRDSVYKV